MVNFSTKVHKNISGISTQFSALFGGEY